ncbi:MAG: hypothetical protein ACE5PO_00450 [Candidatus Bathyarchaeia archaeon]
MPPHYKAKLGDVIVICSNCHRIIHRHKDPLDWKKLRKAIKQSRNHSSRPPCNRARAKSR